MSNDADLILSIDRLAFETPDVLVLDLVAPDRAVLPAWSPGAHIDFVLRSGKVRQYSLCGDPADLIHYRIAILREAAGRGGSAELHATAAAGLAFPTRGPRNHFELVDGPGYLFLAGGIGITPILPMLRATERTGRPWRRSVANHDGLSR
jgi:ferredoxin-NADP reductase